MTKDSGRLRAVRREMGGRASPAPALGWLRRLPAQWAHRRSSVRNPEVGIGAANLLAAKLAIGDAHDQPDRPTARRRSRAEAGAGAHRCGEADCGQDGESSPGDNSEGDASVRNSTDGTTAHGTVPALLAVRHQPLRACW